MDTRSARSYGESVNTRRDLTLTRSKEHTMRYRAADLRKSTRSLAALLAVLALLGLAAVGGTAQADGGTGLVSWTG